MTTTLVFTFIGLDKPGLVETLSNTVSAHGGNWQQSRMTQLAGRFAGITQVQVANTQLAALQQALEALSGDDLSVIIQQGQPATTAADVQHVELSLIGNDRPGILMELSRALAARNINVSDMSTRVISAAMSADLLFEATADIHLPPNQDLAELSDSLDDIANDLSVDISLEPMRGTT